MMNKSFSYIYIYLHLAKEEEKKKKKTSPLFFFPCYYQESGSQSFSTALI